MFRAIVVAGAALAEACGSSDKEPEGSWDLPSFGVHDGGRVPASPSVSQEPDAAATKATTDAVADADATPDASAAVADATEDDASSRPEWGSILVK